jgi:NAD(P)-dependent dehydrogenase (short-subunit alcohol dehydrogenase family)
MLNKLLPGENALITGTRGTIGNSIAIEMAKLKAHIFLSLNPKT